MYSSLWIFCVICLCLLEQDIWHTYSRMLWKAEWCMRVNRIDWTDDQEEEYQCWNEYVLYGLTCWRQTDDIWRQAKQDLRAKLVFLSVMWSSWSPCSLYFSCKKIIYLPKSPGKSILLSIQLMVQAGIQKWSDPVHQVGWVSNGWLMVRVNNNMYVHHIYSLYF